ncbi:MAG: AAA-like domain-containing protein [Polyangia bacterium]
MLTEDSIYIERQADDELRQALLQGDLCYVLACRQIGKSSLLKRTGRWLSREHQVRCGYLDLLGAAHEENTPEGKEKWYRGLVEDLGKSLKLQNAGEFYDRHSDLLPAVRWRRYLYEQVLGAWPEPTRIVIFIDEIDYLGPMPFNTDEFFAVIREVWNNQPEHGGSRRLTFCLSGCVTPGELIRNPAITPFNIGQAIQLEDFSRQALDAPLSSVLTPLGDEAEVWLDEVFKWTAGHPYMTFRLCSWLLRERARRETGSSIEQYVEQCVTGAFLQNGRTQDPCLRHAEQRLSISPHKAELLKLYRRLLVGEPLRYDGGDALQQQLILSGMAAPRSSGERCMLELRNNIFAHVFDQDWVQSQSLKGDFPQKISIWIQNKRSKDLLIPESRLTAAVNWFEDGWREISYDGYQYLFASFQSAIKVASTAARDEQASRVAAEQARLWSERRLKSTYVLVTILVLVVCGLLIVAWTQYQTIRRLKAMPAARALLFNEEQPVGGHTHEAHTARIHYL